MRVVITLTDTSNGCDVEMEAVMSGVQDHAADSLATGFCTNFALLLAAAARSGVKITERGRDASWLKELR